MGKEKKEEKNKPAHEIRFGKVKATIWANETSGGATRHNVQIRRIYKDGDHWKTTDSFGRDDLPLVSKVAGMARSWIYQRTQENG